MSVATIPLRVLPVTARGSLTICIYCGAAVGRRKIFEEQTRAAARVIVAAGHRVYGGAKNGLMGVMADEALKLGGTVVGVIPALLVDKELLHKGLSEIPSPRCTSAKRKCRSSRKSSSRFRAGPEHWRSSSSNGRGPSSAFTRSHAACSNVDGYFAPLRMMVDRMVDEGFLHERHWASLIFSPSIEDVLVGLERFHAPSAKY